MAVPVWNVCLTAVGVTSCKLQHLAALPTGTPESAGLCVLEVIGNLVRITDFQWSGLAARGDTRCIGSPHSQVFPIPALDGSCAQGALGRAGFVSPRSANLRTAATLHSFSSESVTAPVLETERC